MSHEMIGMVVEDVRPYARRASRTSHQMRVMIVVSKVFIQSKKLKAIKLLRGS